MKLLNSSSIPRMDNHHLDAEESDSNNSTANQMSYSARFIVNLAQIICVFVLRATRRAHSLSQSDLEQNGSFATAETVNELFSCLCEFDFPPSVGLLITNDSESTQSELDADEQKNSLEIVNDGESESLVICNATKDHVRFLIMQMLKNPANWHLEQMKLVDNFSCGCGHEFHQFVYNSLIDFLSTPNAAWGSQLHNRAKISAYKHPLCHRRENWCPFRLTPMQFLFDFRHHVMRMEQHEHTRLLLQLLSRAIEKLLCPSRSNPFLEQLADACMFVGQAETNNDMLWPQMLGTVSQEESQPAGPVLFASRSQSDFSVFGDAAGMQCVAMAAMMIRLHHMLRGSLANITTSILDSVLNFGNNLYNICIKASSTPNNRYLNFDELNAGIQQFDRQEWPLFDPLAEGNPNSWDRFASDVRYGFAIGFDGFLMIMQSRAVAVMRDRDNPSQLCLFDSHGRQHIENSSSNQASAINSPAYLLRCESIEEIILNLRLMFKENWPCEIHFYKCN